MFPPPTATKVLFPNVTALRPLVVGEVALSQVAPLSVDLMICPFKFDFVPTPMNTPGDVSIVKEIIARVLLTFPEESVTDIVQSEKVPLLKALKVIVLFPLLAEVVLEEQEPPYVIVPASVDEKV